MVLTPSMFEPPPGCVLDISTTKQLCEGNTMGTMEFPDSRVNHYGLYQFTAGYHLSNSEDAALKSGNALALLAALLALACAGDRPREDGTPQAVGPPTDDVRVERDAGLLETTFTVESGDCRISWTAYESEVNRGVVRHRSDCALALAEQAPLIGRLLRRVTEPGTGTAGFRTLSWGRLYPDGARDATMPVRLALAAMHSPDWDAAEGRPRGGDINGWVRRLANDALIYEEIRPVFREAGLELTLAGVEKVLVQKAELLPFFAELQEAGLRATDVVPFDCQAWFAVERGGAGPR